MPVPSVTFRSELDPVVRKELDQLDGELTAWMLQEHDDDGKHRDVTATSITVGDLIVTGDLTAPGLEASDDLIGETLTVNPGPSHLTGPLDVNGTVTVTGNVAAANVTASNNITATGTVAAANVTASNNVNAANNIGTANLIASSNISAGGSIAAGTSLHDYGRAVPVGVWQDVPYNASDFSSGGGMTWTVTAGQVQTNAYTLIGKTLLWSVMINAGTFSGTSSNAISVKVPPGFSATRSMFVTGAIFDGAWASILGQLDAGTSLLTIYKIPIVPISLGTMYLGFQVMVVIP